MEVLVVAPLEKPGMRLSEVDRYATESHNPAVTDPAGSGKVPLTNYEMIAAPAVQRGEVTPPGKPGWIGQHGMRGFAPTQGTPRWRCPTRATRSTARATAACATSTSWPRAASSGGG